MINQEKEIDPILDALSASLHWHNGDKWRYSFKESERLAWKIHKERLEKALEQFLKKGE